MNRLFSRVLGAAGFFFLGIALVGALTAWSNNGTPPEAVTRVQSTGKVGLNLGDTAPELVAADPSGKQYKLSSLRGKVVLIDFWASWCGPCRRENPNVVMAYDKYTKAKFKNAKGFEIYSVSLDKNKQAWEAAIKQDNLHWPYHVSDLAGWESALGRQYNIRSIPSSILLDADGVIIGKNLRGKDLHLALDELVKSL